MGFKKRPLLDRLIELLQERYGGERDYADKVREIGRRYGKPEILADETNFNELTMVSMELIIEALEQEHINMGLIGRVALSAAQKRALAHTFEEPDPRSLRY